MPRMSRILPVLVLLLLAACGGGPGGGGPPPVDGCFPPGPSALAVCNESDEFAVASIRLYDHGGFVEDFDVWIEPGTRDVVGTLGLLAESMLVTWEDGWIVFGYGLDTGPGASFAAVR